MTLPLPRDAWPRGRSPATQRAVLVAIYALTLVLAAFEIVRATQRLSGIIFTGYAQLGETVLQGGDAYGLAFNTWPPFFLYVAAAIALAVRVIGLAWATALWQVSGVLAVWGSLALLARLLLDGGDLTSFWPRDATRFAFASAALFAPFALTLRLFDENLQHAQINAHVLFLSLLAFHLFRVRRPGWGGLALALAASVKAVPVLLVVFLAYKRAWREVAWTVLWLVALNAVLPVITFGPGDAAAHWTAWRHVAARETAVPEAHYYNQSLAAAFARLFTAEGGTPNPVRFAVAAWPADVVRWACYAVAGAVAATLAWRWRAGPPGLASRTAMAELSLAIGATTLVDPLAWKAHYVTLVAPYFWVWTALRERQARGPRVLLWASVACLTLSARALIGARLSVALESLSVITLGAVLLLAAGAWLLTSPDESPMR